MRFCRHCGRQIEEGDDFCGSCGARVTQEPSLPAQAPVTAPPPRARRSRKGLYGIIATVVVIVAAGASVGGYFLARDGGTTGTAGMPPTYTIPASLASSAAVAATVSSSTSSSTTTTPTEPPFTQSPGEIFLEPAGTAGPEAFAGEVFVPVGPTSTLNIPTSPETAQTGTGASAGTTATTGTTPATDPPAGGAVQVASYSGGAPALYGGSKSKAIADKEGQLRFFEQNPEKAAAFCAALNSDPTFRWSGGTQIRPSQLRDYFAELTPVMLTRDTRVTNYGYRDGRPSPRQSVLQAGQMVLVDRYGVPRVRCECGNPLTPPEPVATTPTYTGPRWPDFDPTTIIVVRQTTVIIETFVLIDVHTGQIFDRPAGTAGEQDEIHEATRWQLDVEMTWDDTREMYQHKHVVNWKAEITADAGGTLRGFGEGIWHCEGTTWRGSSKTGTFTADASFTVDIGGTVETAGQGRVLRIQPTMGDVAVENVEWNTTGDVASLRESLDQNAGSWIGESFTPLDLEAVIVGPLLASVTAGGYTGSAKLTPLSEAMD